MHRCRLVAAALLTLGLCVPAGAQAADCAGADLVPAADNAAVVSQATLCLLNQQRAIAGATALTENGRLTRASAAYSQRMVAEAFFDHDAPDGTTLVDRLTGAGYDVDAAPVVGENIGWGESTLATPRAMVQAWMASPGHRENLLSRDYTQIGLGIALGTPGEGADGATYTTDFGSGKPAKRHASVRNATNRPVQRAACARSSKRARTCARSARSRRR
jgi:uncharacterized protein YkwD